MIKENSWIKNFMKMKQKHSKHLVFQMLKSGDVSQDFQKSGTRTEKFFGGNNVLTRAQSKCK